MAIERKSKQRDAIINELCSRYDHPTAMELYLAVREQIPNLSLGTLYRNLSQLEGDGKILRIDSGGTARYDGNMNPHYHLSCTSCGGVYDIFMEDDCGLCSKASEFFDGKITSYSVLFTGYCSSCAKQAG